MSVLKVYYLSMSNQPLPETPFTIAQIPLLDTTKKDEMQQQSERQEPPINSSLDMNIHINKHEVIMNNELIKNVFLCC